VQQRLLNGQLKLKQNNPDSNSEPHPSALSSKE
jgi:hypothetical protein